MMRHLLAWTSMVKASFQMEAPFPVPFKNPTDPSLKSTEELIDPEEKSLQCLPGSSKYLVKVLQMGPILLEGLRNLAF